MNNPLIQREFFGILRNPRSLAVLVVLAVAFSGMVLLRWPSDALVDLSGAQSRLVFQVFGYGLTLGVLLLVPAFPAASIVRERNRGTLALLLNSPLSAFQIYLGKFTGVFCFTILLLLTSFPAAAACYAMGGVSLGGGLGRLYAMLLVITVQYISLGLLVSTFVQSTDAGVRVTYALVFTLAFLVLGPFYFLQGQPGFFVIIAEWLKQLSPVPVVMEIVGHGGVGTQGLMSTTGTTRFFALAVLTSFALASGTILRLNSRLYDRSRSKGVMTEDRTQVARAARRVFFVIDPQRRKAGIPWYLNPIMVKEFRSRRFGRSHWLLRLIAVCAVVSLLLTLSATTGTMDWGVETIGGLMVLLQVILVVLIAPSLAAGLISGERESGGWELLRMTPLSPLRILIGKLLSVAWTLTLVLLATLPGYLVMIMIKPAMWLQVNLVLVCLVMTAILTLAISTFVSSLFKRTATATSTSYIVLLVVFLGPMMVWLGRDAPFGHRTVEAALLVNPMGAALSVMETPGFQQYELWPFSWYVSGVTAIILAGILSIQIWRISRPT
jgi:ABC-type transport system involved in multi-copper enzyme maturation permease subunit